MVGNGLKNKKTEVKRAQDAKSDLAINKLMLAFVLAVVSVTVMLTQNRSIAANVRFITYVLPVLLILSGIGLAAAAVLFAMRTSRHVYDANRVFTKWNVLGTAVIFFALSLYFKLTLDTTMVVFGLVAATILYFARMIFPADFFAYSVFTAAGAVFLKMSTINYYSAFGNLLKSVCIGLVIVAAVSGIAFAVILAVGKGTITLGDKKFILYERKGHIYPMLIASVLNAAGAVVGFAVSSFMIYVIAALIVAYLAIAVIYAINMM